jgi:hypothetical protein
MPFPVYVVFIVVFLIGLYMVLAAMGVFSFRSRRFSREREDFLHEEDEKPSE